MKELKYFYKIEDNKIKTGSGFKIPDGFIEYDKPNPPKEILDLQFNKLKISKKQEIKSVLNNYLSVYHLNNGINVINNLQEQSNNLNSLLFSQMALKSPKWAKSTDYKVNDVVYVNDVLLLCITAGKSDSSNNPTPPTDYGVSVTDGTAEWAKLGFLVKTDKGRIYFTPQQIIEMSEEATAILHEALTKYDTLKKEIAAATTKEDLDKIKW